MNMVREAIHRALTTNMSNRKIATTVNLSHTTIANYKRALSEKNLSGLL
jgi:transposase